MNFQPKGYRSLFGIFMLERISYYGVRSLLVLFMVKYLLISSNKAGNIYGWFMLIMLSSPILGGFIADRWLGHRKAIVWSVAITTLGCFLLTITSLTSSIILFYVALSLLLIGGMLFKPNIYTTLGNVYDSEKDSRRDSGFTLIVVAVSLGAFLAPIICGTLGEKVGWSMGFLAAGIFMILILPLFKFIPENTKKLPSKANYKKTFFIMFLILLGVYLLYSLGDFSVDFSSVVNMSLPWMRILLLSPPYLFFIIFPLLWFKLSKTGREPTSMSKLTLGLVFMLVALIIIATLQRLENANLSIIVGTGILLGLSEVCIAPIIVSLVTKIAPKKWSSTFIGAWFTFAGLVVGLVHYPLETKNKTLILSIGLVFCGIILLTLLRNSIKQLMIETKN